MYRPKSKSYRWFRYYIFVFLFRFFVLFCLNFSTFFSSIQKSSGGKFRSTDLQVMSLPRYHCATPLSYFMLFALYTSKINISSSKELNNIVLLSKNWNDLCIEGIVCSFVYLFYLFVHCLIDLFIYSFIYCCICSFILSIWLSTWSFWYKKFHHRESNPGRKRERLACYQLHHNGLLYHMKLHLLRCSLAEMFSIVCSIFSYPLKLFGWIFINLFIYLFFCFVSFHFLLA